MATAKNNSVTGEVKNAIDGRSKFLLANWIIANQQELRIIPRPDIAKRATAELGFVVTVPNITSAERAAGVLLQRPRAPATANPNGDRVRILSLVLRDLVIRLGEPVDPRLVALCAGKKP